MKFFIMFAQSCVEEYVRPGNGLNVLHKACRFSEFQYLDRSTLDVEISDDSGDEFTDFILQGIIPLVSTRLKRVLEKFKVDYVFYKPVRLTCSSLGIAEDYFLALPPRINCLDEERSLIVESKSARLAKKIFIDEEKIGRYEIFKLADFENQDIIITERLKEVLAANNFENLYFSEMGE